MISDPFGLDASRSVAGYPGIDAPFPDGGFALPFESR